MRKAITAAAGIGIPLAGYSGLVEPNRVTVERLEFAVAGWPRAFDGFRIAQLSDFHFGPFTGESEIGRAVAAVETLNADLIALTGDFITGEGNVSPEVATNVALCARLLGQLKAPHGVFACLGNHDVAWNAAAVIESLLTFRIRTLRNSNIPIESDRARFWLAGVDDDVQGHADHALAMRGIPPAAPVIMLAHEPDLADRTSLYDNVVAQLSGHSHGGQVRLPLVGCPFLPRLAVKYPYGYYRIRNMHLYTNRGIGTIMLPLRFNAPPEVTLITLRCK